MLIGVLSVGSAGWSEDAGQTVRIQLPSQFDPTKAIVLVGQFGDGLGVGVAARVGDTREFQEQIAGSTISARVVVFYPGCKLAITNLERSEIAELVTPKLAKLVLVPTTIRLTTSNGTGIPNQTLALTQPMLNMAFYGLTDRLAGKGYTPVVASGVTDATGRLALKVPRLIDDPVFEKSGEKPIFGVRLEERIPQAAYDLVPSSIPSQESYGGQQIVKLIYRGKISGQIDAAFLGKHGITASLGKALVPDGRTEYKVWFQAHESSGKGGQGVAFKDDGTFSMELPPATYDLAVEVWDENGRPEKTISIQKGLVLSEGEDRRITLE
jgi:hypothetical protein